MASISAALQHLDLVATRQQLLAQGLSVRDLARAVHTGAAVRVQRGWYAHPSASLDLVESTRVGGRMACFTAARSYGLWVLDDARLHVHVPESASRLRSRRDRHASLGDRRADGTCVHREPTHMTPATRLRVSVTEALAEIIGHGERESAIVALDSAAHNGMLAKRQLLAILPAKYRPWLDEVRGEAESGLETLVRVRLAIRGIPTRLQVRLGDGIRVDLLIGERLVIEVDGRQFHDDEGAFEQDRRRDLFLKAFDYEVLRLSYQQVMDDWGSVQVALDRMIAQGRHLARSQLMV